MTRKVLAWLLLVFMVAGLGSLVAGICLGRRTPDWVVTLCYVGCWGAWGINMYGQDTTMESVELQDGKSKKSSTRSNQESSRDD